MRLRRSLIAALCVAAAGCAVPKPAPTPPAPTPQPAPPPTLPPPPAPANWMDAAQTPGDWYYRTGGGTSRALFGVANQDSLLTLTCDPARRTVAIYRAGALGGPTQMIVRSETASRTLIASPAPGAAPAVAASLGARDPLLDAMAFSKGRFAIEVQGLAPLYLPSWPEVTRVIEDCR
jgi:hypothetical protein